MARPPLTSSPASALATSLMVAAYALAALGACKKPGESSGEGDAAPRAPDAMDAGSVAVTKPSATESPAPLPALATDAGASLAQFLPVQAGRFVGRPLETGGYYVRRTYADSRSYMEVTLADARDPSIRATPRGEHTDFFLRESSAYPQIKLDIPKGTGSGFYDCPDTERPERCSGYIMLFDGYSVEVLNGDATRSDVDALISALPLRALATLR